MNYRKACEKYKEWTLNDLVTLCKINMPHTVRLMDVYERKGIIKSLASMYPEVYTPIELLRKYKML